MLNKFLLINWISFILFILFSTGFFVRGDEMIIEIDNPRFSEKGLIDKIYEIKAKKGLKSDSNLELFVIEGKFKTEEDGKWIYLEADEGNFSQVNDFIVLKNNIVFYTDGGEKFKSDKATFDMNNDIIKLNENVSHENTNGLIHADSSVISENFNNIEYTGNVSSILKTRIND